MSETFVCIRTYVCSYKRIHIYIYICKTFNYVLCEHLLVFDTTDGLLEQFFNVTSACHPNLSLPLNLYFYCLFIFSFFFIVFN